MYGLGFAILLLLASCVHAGGKIAIIVDDLGYNLANDRAALNIGGAITYAILPRTPYAHQLASEANQKGLETMLHLPMQPEGYARPGKGALNKYLNEQTFKRIVRENIMDVPHISGLNNHMGSQLTSDPQRMVWLMQVMTEYPTLYFVDSRTTDKTVAQDVARQYGILNSRRHVFLDNHHDDKNAIARQFDELLAKARKRGVAVGIAHPYPQTIKYLKQRLAELNSPDVQLVPVSHILQEGKSTWHASLSP